MDSCIENYMISEELTVDPELEKIRQGILNQERIDYNKIADVLASKVDHVHSAYLFEAEGIEILRDLCRLISSTPSCINYKSWKDLGAVLGLDCSVIGCIENYKDDYTVTVLLTFAQDPDASLSRLVYAFKKLERYDALAIAVNKFPELCKQVEARYDRRTCNQNINHLDFIENNKTKSIVKSKLLTPDNLPSLSFRLPITLRNQIDEYDASAKKLNDLDIIQDIQGIENIVNRVNILTNASPSIIKGPQYKHKQVQLSKKAMLTFANDGKRIAAMVEAEFYKRRGSLGRIGVLTLDNHAEKVLQNPEHFISHQFAKMDYIIPIVTKGYVDILCNKPNLYNLDLDSKYIKLIHNHMTIYYTENFCMNDKIRCIMDKSSGVINHPHMKKDPVFKVYCYDDQEEIEKLADRLAKASGKRKE